MDFQVGMIAVVVFVALIALWLIFYFIPVGLWFSALVSGVRISLLQLVLMRWLYQAQARVRSSRESSILPCVAVWTSYQMHQANMHRWKATGRASIM